MSLFSHNYIKMDNISNVLPNLHVYSIHIVPGFLIENINTSLIFSGRNPLQSGTHIATVWLAIE